MARNEQSLEESQDSERTPLLLSNVTRHTPTPLPWRQLFVLFWIQLAEPLTSQVIYPFINKVRTTRYQPAITSDLKSPYFIHLPDGQ